MRWQNKEKQTYGLLQMPYLLEGGYGTIISHCPQRHIIIIKGVARINFPTNETAFPRWAAISHIMFSEVN